MKVKQIKFQINKIQFKDSYNYKCLKDNDCLFEIDKGVFKFHDKPTMIRFMLQRGITCGAELRIINHKSQIFYNNQPANEGQIEFLRNRARALMSITDMNSGIVIKNDCKCKKKRPK